ncbi:unnamed protein product (macronuclear) [Paramecium tetraurelia]|uniref:Uncharacterized protein n=1 Tax=Paramecium tetraurelia TaxID=5888 RepID=A0C9E4_PARTE|nr:uncharacterized protein GSPATT00006717001 [Paramecium tetraurelia]CAK67411.1 unnamed protein product [Paramecium tetraurelia]|eukprot:XP_001434808.1 hypothetical protein (macronuclear) [Paramecium tetraurelia strain d4-2]
MAENKPINAKIKIVKTNHQISSSAANPHNTYLDGREAQELSQSNRPEFPSDINIYSNILEWYIRTLGDELYKLAFINKEKYYRIKVFWPQDYEAFLLNDPKNTMQVENANQQRPKQIDNVRYYLNQFQGFEIEDYFDIIIFPKIDKAQNNGQRLQLRVLVNPFTYYIQEYSEQKFQMEATYSKIEGLELFVEYESKLFFTNTIDILQELTNHILQKYVLRQEYQQDKIKITMDQLRNRMAPIIKEETRVVLYELYKDL